MQPSNLTPVQPTSPKGQLSPIASDRRRRSKSAAAKSERRCRGVRPASTRSRRETRLPVRPRCESTGGPEPRSDRQRPVAGGDEAGILRPNGPSGIFLQGVVPAVFVPAGGGFMGRTQARRLVIQFLAVVCLVVGGALRGAQAGAQASPQKLVLVHGQVTAQGERGIPVGVTVYVE